MQDPKDILTGILGLGAIGAVLWVPLAPALIWSKPTISTQEKGKLFRRTAQVSLLAGTPVMFLVLLVVGYLDPVAMPLPRRLVAAAATAVGSFPFYCAIVTTVGFELDHKAHAARGEPERPLFIRVLTILVILGTNMVAGVFLLFFIGAAAGAYRGYN